MPYDLDQLSFAAFQRGDNNIFSKVFNAYNDEIYLYCYKLLKDSDLAEDMTADTIMALWKKKATITDPTTIVGYLYATAYNNCMNHFRKERYRKNLLMELWYSMQGAKSVQDEVDPLDIIEQKVPGGILRAIGLEMDNLPPQTLKVFRMLYVEMRTPAEIADILDLDVNTVYDHRQRAMRLIRQAISERNLLLLLIVVLLLCKIL